MRKIQIDLKATDRAKVREIQLKAEEMLQSRSHSPTSWEWKKAQKVRFRCRILEIADKDWQVSTVVIAPQVCCSKHVVRDVLRKLNEFGLLALFPDPPGRKKDDSRSSEIEDALQQLHDANPQAKPAELREGLKSQHDIDLGLVQVRRYLRKLGIGFRRSEEAEINYNCPRVVVTPTNPAVFGTLAITNISSNSLLEDTTAAMNVTCRGKPHF